MTHEVPDGAPDRGDPVPGLLGALRDGWHSLGGGDAASCPGCPVCRLGESAARLDPGTTEHLQQAVGHLAAAGRELLAALQAADRTPPRAGRPPVDPTDGTWPRRTRIPVDHDPDDPKHSDEEHP